MSFISGTYHFYSDVIFPNGEKSTYSKLLDIEVGNAQSGFVAFSINGCHDERIDGQPPKEFNLLMACLGHALFPLHMMIEEEQSVSHIINLAEIATRYKKEGERIIDYYEQAPSVQQYIKSSLENLSSEKLFTRNIEQTNFFQLIRIALLHKKTIPYIIQDFPSAGEAFSLTFQKREENDLNGIFYDASGEKGIHDVLSVKGQISMQENEKGDIGIVQMQCRVEIADEGYYNRKAEIELIR